MRAANPAPHMNATTETASVSTPAAATVSSSTATSPARRRVSGQSPESGSRSQNDHGFTQHWTYSFRRELGNRPGGNRRMNVHHIGYSDDRCDGRDVADEIIIELLVKRRVDR